jgi:hypothetical protein
LWKAGFEYLGNNHSEFNEEPLLKIQLLIKKFTLLDSLLSLLLDYAVIDRPNEANYGSLYRTKI